MSKFAAAAALGLIPLAARAHQAPPDTPRVTLPLAAPADPAVAPPGSPGDARAQELTLRPQPPRSHTTDSAVLLAAAAGEDGPREPFDKGTWSLQFTGNYYDNFSGNDVTLAYATASLGYYFADNWAFDVSLSGYDLEENGQDEGVAGSFGVNLRSHFLVRDPFSLYLDGGVGIIRADGRFPEGGTNTNFTLQAGLGATYRLTDSLHLVGGGRWFHISNARRRGKDRNASTDGTAVYLGVMWTW